MALCGEVSRTSPRVSAVVLAYHRPAALSEVLGRLADLPVDEVVVYDNSDDDEAAAVARGTGGNVRLLKGGGNMGIAGRNRAAEAATGDYLLFLDDDSYPLPGAVEELLAVFERLPRTGAVGGLVRDVDDDKRVTLDTQVGTFDWWLRSGAVGEPPPDGFPAFFFPEGASMVRREAFLEVGGFYEPFHFTGEGIDLAVRLLAAGWDVRYQPRAVFDHMKAPAGRTSTADTLRLRVRNNLWHLWLRFPWRVAVPRMAAYLLFDLANAVYRRSPSSWTGGVADAWRLRHVVRGDRRPVPASVLRRVEGGRLRMHRRLVAHRLRSRLRRGQAFSVV